MNCFILFHCSIPLIILRVGGVVAVGLRRDASSVVGSSPGTDTWVLEQDTNYHYLWFSFFFWNYF